MSAPHLANSSMARAAWSTSSDSSWSSGTSKGWWVTMILATLSSRSQIFAFTLAICSWLMLPSFQVSERAVFTPTTAISSSM
jgi:hypothetical protein